MSRFTEPEKYVAGAEVIDFANEIMEFLIDRVPHYVEREKEARKELQNLKVKINELLGERNGNS